MMIVHVLLITMEVVRPGAAAVLILGAIVVVLVTVRHLIRGEKYVSI